MGSKILVSGYKGFVGYHLYKYLQQNNCEVLGLSRCIENSNTVTKNFTWNNLDKIPNNQIDVFIHLAGKAHDIKKTTDPEEYFKINTGLTKKIFDIFLKSGARDFIFLSSVKAVADTVDGELNEMVIPNPKTAYGKSKLEAEEYLLNFTMPQGKRIFILRPCMIHGPGNKGNFNLLYQFIKRRIPYPLAAYQNKRSFLSIENLCFVISQIINHPNISQGIYNIADDYPLSTNELVKLIGEEINIKPISWKIDPSIIKVIAKMGDVFNLPINSDRLIKLTENYVVNNSKIKAALQIESLPISSKNGFSITLKSF